MSVTFYDADNPAVYDEYGDQLGGGQTVNISNSNAAHLLVYMGITDPNDPNLYGELDGDSFRRCVIRALANVDLSIKNDSSMFEYYEYAKDRLGRFLTVFADTRLVCWS